MSPLKKIKTPHFCGVFWWLARKDSNLDKESQNLLCYRYTTGHHGRSLSTGDFITSSAFNPNGIDFRPRDQSIREPDGEFAFGGFG